MVQLNVASIREISIASEIRREEIYRMLPDLEKMGLIEKILGKPLNIKAIPVEVTLSLLIERVKKSAQDRLSSLDEKKEMIITDFNTIKFLPQLEAREANFSLVKNRDVIIAKGVSMLNDIKKEMNIVTSLDGFRVFLHLFGDYEEIIKKVQTKGVKSRIILNTRKYDNTILSEYKKYSKFLDLKYSNERLNNYMTIDDNEALISTTAEPFIENTPYLWTDDKNLVKTLNTNFERAWNASFNAIDFTDKSDHNFLRVINSLKPMNHIMFSYSNQEEKHSVLFNYIKIGLDNDEVAVYITTEETAYQIREAMRRFGIDTEKYEKTGALHIIESSYEPSEGFNINSTIDYLKKFYDAALTNGFKGCRICGEMEYFFKNDLIEKMLEYEKTLNRIFTTPIIGICAFNKNTINDFDDPCNLFCQLAMAHSSVLTMNGNNLQKVEIHRF
jgi:sugar-specific transcriptional regulator TrmB